MFVLDISAWSIRDAGFVCFFSPVITTVTALIVVPLFFRLDAVTNVL